jgi:formate hydrogenlyase subunit 3/multisubunit Na+/H+ antiporter MnhD subunit
MPLLAVLPILLPLVGAGGTFGLSRVSFTRRFVRYVALVAAGLTLLSVFVSRWLALETIIPSFWRPSVLFGSMLAFQISPDVQPLAVALALVTFSAVLVQCTSTEQIPTEAAALGLVAAGFAALGSANVLTLVTSWAVYDLMETAGRTAAGNSGRSTVRGLVLNGLSTAFLWGGALVSDGGALTRVWSLIDLNEPHIALWAMAGILRLSAYPFHLSTPDELSRKAPAVVPLFMGPLIGWGFWLRIVSVNGGTMPRLAWIPTLAAITIVLGGFLAWTSVDRRRMLPWVGVSVTGTILLAACLSSTAAPAVIVTGSVAWALGSAVLFLDTGSEEKLIWWQLPAWVGALVLIGLPLTLGFVAQATLAGQLVQGSHLEWGVAFFLGQLFLLPSLIRLLLPLRSDGTACQSWAHDVARGVGLGLPALLLIAAGIHPPLLSGAIEIPSLGKLFATPGLAGWLLWLVTLAVGSLLAWQDRNLRSRVAYLLSAGHDLLRLEWLYDLFAGAAERGLTILQATDDLIGGAGAVLWSLVLFLIVLLVLGS